MAEPSRGTRTGGVLHVLQFRPAYKKDRTLTLVQNFLRELGSLYKTFLGKNFLSNSYLVIFFDFDRPEKANFAAPENFDRTSAV